MMARHAPALSVCSLLATAVYGLDWKDGRNTHYGLDWKDGRSNRVPEPRVLGDRIDMCIDMCVCTGMHIDMCGKIVC